MSKSVQRFSSYGLIQDRITFLCLPPKKKINKYTKSCIWHTNRTGFSLKLRHIKIFAAKIFNRLASSRNALWSVTVVKILTKTWTCQRIFVRDIAQYETSWKPITNVRRFAWVPCIYADGEGLLRVDTKAPMSKEKLWAADSSDTLLRYAAIKLHDFSSQKVELRSFFQNVTSDTNSTVSPYLPPTPI